MPPNASGVEIQVTISFASTSDAVLQTLSQVLYLYPDKTSKLGTVSSVRKEAPMASSRSEYSNDHEIHPHNILILDRYVQLTQTYDSSLA